MLTAFVFVVAILSFCLGWAAKATTVHIEDQVKDQAVRHDSEARNRRRPF